MESAPPPRRPWGLILALVGSLLLNLGLVTSGVRQWRGRHRLELELARLQHPWGTRLPRPTADGGLLAEPVAPPDGGPLAGPPASKPAPAVPPPRIVRARPPAPEGLRERRARRLMALPTSPVIELRSGAAAGGPRGRAIVGEHGDLLAASVVGLPPPGGEARQLRVYVDRQGVGLRHVGVLAVDVRGNTEGLFDLPPGPRINAVELRWVRPEQPAAETRGERVLHGSAVGR